MKGRTVVLFLPLAVASCLHAELIARDCAPWDPKECQYLFTDGFVKLGRSPDPDKAVILGPYMREYKNLVSRSEAPLRELVSPGHWRVVVTRGFDDKAWRPGTIFHLYFFDPHGVLRLKSAGDLFLERARIGYLFGTSTELLAVCQRSETGISYSTQVWVLPAAGSPQEVLFEGGGLGSVSAGVKGKLGGLYITYLIDGKGDSQSNPTRVFWRWEESAKKFVRQ